MIPVGRPDIERRISAALASPAMVSQRAVPARVGLEIDRMPLLWKHLPGPSLRLMFPVGDGVVSEGTVVCVVVLYDVAREQTVYARLMHAGPEVNPLLKHLDGPLAMPKAQPGASPVLCRKAPRGTRSPRMRAGAGSRSAAHRGHGSRWTMNTTRWFSPPMLSGSRRGLSRGWPFLTPPDESRSVSPGLLVRTPVSP